MHAHTGGSIYCVQVHIQTLHGLPKRNYPWLRNKPLTAWDALPGASTVLLGVLYHPRCRRCFLHAGLPLCERPFPLEVVQLVFEDTPKASFWEMVASRINFGFCSVYHGMRFCICYHRTSCWLGWQYTIFKINKYNKYIPWKCSLHPTAELELLSWRIWEGKKGITQRSILILYIEAQPPPHPW